MRRYRLLDHTADIRLRIFGHNLRELFQNSVYALTDTLTDAKKVRTKVSRSLKIKGEGNDLLLHALLKEVLFLFDTKRFLTRRLVIKKLSDKILLVTLRGERLKDHAIKTEIKAVTYHRLKVEKRRGRWIGEVVLDV
ncbi:MAG: archease [Deltaproteobacteria bacterium]|nr:archease [Deltaproteobacteria bacterium]